MALSRTAWVAGLSAVQGLALLGTYFLPVGTEAWHHLATLGLVMVMAFALPKPMSSRRFLGVGVLATTVLATVSGFYLLYWKEGIRADGYQDWGVFWHVAWSWAAAVFFVQHTWVNRVALGHFFSTSVRRLAPAVLHTGLYVLAIVGFVLSAGPGRTWFSNENYIPLSLWTWLAATVCAYAAWWVFRWRSHATQKRVRGGVDLALVPVAAVTIVSGIPLLFLDARLDAAGLKYASKFWHVGPSVLFAVLVFVHSVQLWTGLKRHWQRVGRLETNVTGIMRPPSARRQESAAAPARRPPTPRAAAPAPAAGTPTASRRWRRRTGPRPAARR